MRMPEAVLWISTAATALGTVTASLAQTPPAPVTTSAPATQRLALDEGLFLKINGVEQWVTIRGQNAANPVLLFLHGGPGLGNSSMAPFFADWEKHYTLVQWDQPGGGWTELNNLGKDRGAMTIARFTADGIAVTEQLLARLKTKKLVLMGNSWGSLIGLEMIKRRPELFSAFVGSSQPVGGRGNVLGYELALEAARKRNDAAAIAALEKVGPPPYKSFEDFMVRQTYSNPPALPSSPAEQAASAEMWRHMVTPPPAGSKYVAAIAIPQGYDWFKNFLDTQRLTFQETWNWDAKKLGSEFKVPVFVFQGSDDINTPLAATREWFDGIKAPRKGFAVVEGAGHNTIAFQAELLKLLDSQVLPVVAPGASVARR
jgi:pimeloyl-ACP methyl ester carboxylesterase